MLLQKYIFYFFLSATVYKGKRTAAVEVAKPNSQTLDWEKYPSYVLTASLYNIKWILIVLQFLIDMYYFIKLNLKYCKCFR